MTIRQSTPADKPSILSLLNQELGETRYFNWPRDEAFWHWKYESNVFGKPVIFVAEADGKLIGSRTLWPWEFVCRGRALKAFQPGDTVVHSDFQGKGIFSKLNKKSVPYIVETGIPIVFNFPNQNSVNGYLNSGWHYLANIPWLIKPIKPLRILLGQKSKKATSLKLESQHIIDPNSCHQISNKNLSFDGIIRTHRVPGFFRWRYFDHPFFYYGLVSVKEGRKEAGAVFTIYDKGLNKEMLVVDFIGHPDCSKALFKKLINTGKQYNVDFITTIYNKHSNMKQLWKLGFVKTRRKNMVVLPTDPSLETLLTNYDNWFLVGGMHDSI